MALSVRPGGLTNPSTDATSQHEVSKKITAPLAALIMEQSFQYTNTTKARQLTIKQAAAKAKRHRESQAAVKVQDKLPTSMQRAMSLSTEKGSSSWLSALPVV